MQRTGDVNRERRTAVTTAAGHISINEFERACVAIFTRAPERGLFALIDVSTRAQLALSNCSEFENA